MDEELNSSATPELEQAIQEPTKDAGASNAENQSARFSEVLREEVKLIDRLRTSNSKPSASQEQSDPYAEAHARNLTGLAFSGGGIRSATFNLGVIQGLSAFGVDHGNSKSLMSRFDYLSTVSGGGYIGSWFTAWLHRNATSKGETADEKFLNEMRFKFVAHPTLKEEEPTDKSAAARSGAYTENTSGFAPLEHDTIRFLRRYSNYLTPKLGLSGDMLALISIFLRNFILMQMALVSFLTAIIMAFYLLAAASVKIIYSDRTLFGIDLPQVTVGLGGLALIGILFFFSRQIAEVPVDKHSAGKHKLAARDAGNLAFWNGMLVVICLLASWLIVISGVGTSSVAPVTSYIGVCVAIYALAWAFCHGTYIFRVKAQTDNFEHFKAKIAFGSLISSVFSGGVFGAIAFGCAHALASTWATDQHNTLAIITFGPPSALLILSFVVTMHIGTAGGLFSEMHREWWARIGGFVLFALSVWTIICLVTYYAAPLLRQLGNGGFAALATWAGASGAGALLASNTTQRVGSGFGSTLKTLVLRVAPWVFLLGMAVIVSFALNAVFLSVTDGWAKWPETFSFFEAVDIATTELRSVSIVQSFFACLIAGLAFALVTRGLDINIFSAHSMYKNRLTRAYLGASTGKTRYEHPFTGFSSTDDIALESLNNQRPIHIVNTTVNMTGGDDLAWQTRRAASFSFTPNFVGFESKSSNGSYVGGYRATRYYASNEEPGQEDDNSKGLEADKVDQEYVQDSHAVPEQEQGDSENHQTNALEGNEGASKQKDSQNAAVKTEKGKDGEKRRPKGIELGTAMAISGAAASPNMGYHTAPTVAALLTAFNLRLGYWGGNTSDVPAGKSAKRWTAWWKKRPTFSARPIFAELTGSANARSHWINLSDGGHFDNLGIYELVRRRCRFIVVTDAGCDPEHQFDDLANATRKCWTDFGVHISFPDLDDVSLKHGSNGFVDRHCTLGTVEYVRFDKDDPRRYGLILYIKSSITLAEYKGYVDLRQYLDANESFPHETTADQYFDENQFEAYRHLGYCVVESCRQEIGQFFNPESGYLDVNKVYPAARELCALSNSVES